MTLHEQLALKARLPRAWPAFFERYGSFTPAQLLAIPPLLAGANLLLCAPTAGGKTAAALAPLLERHCPPRRPPNTLRILYLTPTRALVNDLRTRLAHPLATLGVRLGVKTGDGSFAAGRPPDLLLTTPESLDSLLATRAALFSQLQAVVIDELHIFDGTPRGDQLLALLARLAQVRAYAASRGDAPDAGLQRVALSATLVGPEAAATRYLGPAQVVRVPGGRALNAELIAMGATGAGLHELLASCGRRGWRKLLAFCNSRAEVEACAAAVRDAGSFGGGVFTHYSNLEPRRRREIEQSFAAAEAAICFTSSTLELGIDIGSIDAAVLIGPPGSAASFAQRLGRANRRGGAVNLACCYHTPLERLLFQALLETSERAMALPQGAAAPAFRPSVAVQQIFSLIKQSPTAALRPVQLEGLFAGLLAPAELGALLTELSLRGYLAPGRPGELRAGERLARLFDQQIGPQVELSIHSNLQASPGPTIEVRDQHTGRAVARVDALWLGRDQLTLEGRPVSVTWSDGEALWVSADSSRSSGEQGRRPIYRSGRQLLAYELARLLPDQLGLAPGVAPFIAAGAGYCWFHWLGDLYGQALLDLLRYTTPAEAGEAPGLALLVSEPPRAAPAWDEALVIGYLKESYRRLEPLLDLGAFHHLLPPALRQSAVVARFDVPRFLAALAELRPVPAPEPLTEGLARLADLAAV